MEQGFYSEKEFNQLVTDLVEAIRRQKLVIFVGAGVSISQGYPNWDGYVDHLIKYWQSQVLNLASDNKFPRENFLVFDTISKVKLSNKRKIDLVNYSIRQIIGDDEFKQRRLDFEKDYFKKLAPFQPSNEVLEFLVNIDAIFITPNYDLEIENHARRLRNTVRTVNDLQEFVDNNGKLEWGDILHIHGTPDCNPDYFVSASADYSKTYLRDRANFNQLRKWFKEEKPTVLFVGVSLEEDEILSLLYPTSKNYALLKADSSENTNVDRAYRTVFNNFFEKENHTKIIWYGDSFDDLPKFVENVKNRVDDEIGLSLPKKEWELLLNPKSEQELCVEALNHNSDDVGFLNDLYRRLLKINSEELMKKLLRASLDSSVITSSVINRFDSFWDFIYKNNEFLIDKDWEKIKKVFLAGNQNIVISSFYKIYLHCINEKIFSSDELSEIRKRLAQDKFITNTDFINDRDLMGEWFVDRFTKTTKNNSHDYFIGANEHIYTPKDKDFEVNLTKKHLEDLLKTKEISSNYVFNSIDEILSEGILKLLYELLLNDKIFIEGELLIENIPEAWIESRIIQKILVLLDNKKYINNELVKRLINKIDFSDKRFGSELNAFIKKHENILSNEGIETQEHYHDLIGDTAIFSVVDESFISEIDLMTLQDNDLVKKMIESRDHIFDFDNSGKEKTANATVSFLLEILKSDNLEVKDKVINLIKNKGKELYSRYASLYYEIIASDIDDLELKDISKEIYLDNFDNSHFSNTDEKFFNYFINDKIEVEDIIVSKLFSTNINNLETLMDNKDTLDMTTFINSELGRYLMVLINMVRSNAKYGDRILQTIASITQNSYKEFMEGVFLLEIKDADIEISYNTFLGYIYYHKSISTEISKNFRNVVVDLLQEKVEDDRALQFSILVALDNIQPSDIKFEQNNFSQLIYFVFTYKDKFQFEKEWLQAIISHKSTNDNILSSFVHVLTLDNLNLPKYKEFLDSFEEIIKSSNHKIDLYMLIYYLREKELSDEKRKLLVKYILILLSNNCIEKNFHVIESLLQFLPHLNDEQIQNLLYSESVQALLSPTESERFRKEASMYNGKRKK